MPDEPKALTWAKQLQAIGQTGLAYADDVYDAERYRAVVRIAAEILAETAALDADAVHVAFSRDDGYATPKVDVRGVVIEDDGILLVQERSDGLWTLPGGWADVGESARESVEREVAEEAGYTVRARKLLAVYDRAKHPHVPPFPFHIYKLFILCEITGTTARDPTETSNVGFFREDALPPLSLTRVVPEQIRRLFAHRRNPDWPTDFD